MSNPSMLNCPIVAISQFSRASTDKEGQDVERKMRDLKGSSSIEQNAAIIMFTKHILKNGRNGATDSIEIKIAKNRHGILGNMEIPIIPKYHRLDCDYVSKEKYRPNE